MIDESLLNCDDIGLLTNDPTLVNAIPLKIGTLYTFPSLAKTCLLEPHIHDEESLHFTVVLKGKVKVKRFTDVQKFTEHHYGHMDIADFKIGELHSIEPLTEGAIVLNVVKSGMKNKKAKHDLMDITFAVNDLKKRLETLQKEMK